MKFTIVMRMAVFTACENKPLAVGPPKQPGQKPLQHSSALFLLGLKEKHKLTQVTIEGVIEGVSSLNQHQSFFKTHFRLGPLNFHLRRSPSRIPFGFYTYMPLNNAIKLLVYIQSS